MITALITSFVWFALWRSYGALRSAKDVDPIELLRRGNDRVDVPPPIRADNCDGVALKWDDYEEQMNRYRERAIYLAKTLN